MSNPSQVTEATTTTDSPLVVAALQRLEEHKALVRACEAHMDRIAEDARTIKDMEAEIDRMAKGLAWRCFHCGEVFVDEQLARVHFGATEDADAACKIAERTGGILEALRRAEGEVMEWRGRALQAEANEQPVELFRAELARYFKGATTAWGAFCLLDSEVGRRMVAEEQRQGLVDALTNTADLVQAINNTVDVLPLHVVDKLARIRALALDAVPKQS